MKKMMRVFLRALVCGILPVCLLLSGVAVSAYTGSHPQQLTAGADIRFMTYNVLVDQDTANGGYNWGGSAIDGNRGPKAVAMIEYYKPDVIALQEFSGNWYTYFKNNLPDYAFGEMNSKDTQNNGKLYTCVAYNTKTLRLLDTDLYRMRVSKWGTQGMRYVNVCFFEVIATGKKFIAASTHTDAGALNGDGFQRSNQVKEIADYLTKLSQTYQAPVICGGDYNCSSGESASYNHMTNAGFVDATAGRYIDHIFYNSMASHRYEITVSDADVSGASDHQPVFADMALEEVLSFPTTTTTTTTTTTGTWTTTAPKTVAPMSKPTDADTTTAGTTAADTTTGVLSDPTKEPDSTTPTLDATVPTTDAPIGEVSGSTDTTTTSSTAEPEAEDQPVEADPVPKGNDALLYIGIAVAAAAVAVGAGVALFFLLKKKK